MLLQSYIVLISYPKAISIHIQGALKPLFNINLSRHLPGSGCYVYSRKAHHGMIIKANTYIANIDFQAPYDTRLYLFSLPEYISVIYERLLSNHAIKSKSFDKIIVYFLKFFFTSKCS